MCSLLLERALQRNFFFLRKVLIRFESEIGARSKVGQRCIDRNVCGTTLSPTTRGLVTRQIDKERCNQHYHRHRITLFVKVKEGLR
jgi:hypothetical protein